MRRYGAIFTLITVTLIIPIASQVAAGEVPGVTDDEIRIGTITDLTGPLAFLGKEVSDGTGLFFRYVNDQGGIYGRKIKHIVEDDGYQPPRSVAAFRKLVDRDQVFCLAGNMGSSTNLAVIPFVERERIPLIGPAGYNSNMSHPPRRHVFAVDPSYPVQSWIIVKHILEAERSEAPRLAILYQDDDYGRDGLKGLHQAAAHYGLTIVAEERYKRGAVDFSTQALRLRQAAPTHVLLFTVTRETAAILEEAHHLDWHPRFFGAIPASEDKIIELAGEAASDYMALNTGDYRSDPLATQEAFYFGVLKEYDPERSYYNYHGFGFGIGQLLVEGLRRAGPDLTREKLVEAMESFDNWRDMVGAPVSYGPGLRGGRFTAAFLLRADVARGMMVRATDWLDFEKPEESDDATRHQ